MESVETGNTYKVAYNSCFGGFSLSREAILLGRKLSGNDKWAGAHIKGDAFEDGTIVDYDFGFIDDMPRHDPLLIQVIETLKERASGSCAKVEVAEISQPLYRMDEYDGRETVVEPDDYIWRNAAEAA